MGAARAVPAAGQLPLPPALPAAAAQLLDQAHRGLAEAAGCRRPPAALRRGPRRGAAGHRRAAGRPAPGPAAPARRPQKNAWVLLAEVAPELGEWAAFFAAGAAKRAAAEAGLARAVTEREADDLVRDADRFLGAGRDSPSG